MGNFLETVLGIQILLARNGLKKNWSDDIPFCHKIPCNTYHVMLHVASHTLSMPVFAGQNNAEVEETNQDVAQQICKPQCNF